MPRPLASLMMRHHQPRLWALSSDGPPRTHGFDRLVGRGMMGSRLRRDATDKNMSLQRFLSRSFTSTCLLWAVAPLAIGLGSGCSVLRRSGPADPQHLPSKSRENADAAPRKPSRPSPAESRSSEPAAGTLPDADSPPPDNLAPAASTGSPTAAADPSSPLGTPPPPVIETEPTSVEGGLRRPPGKVNQSVFDEELARWNVGGCSDPAHPSNRARYHVGTRVQIDVVGKARQGRKLAQPTPRAETRLLAQLRSLGYWRVRLCFEDRSDDRADREGGTASFRARVGRSGRLLGLRPVKTGTLDRKVVECIREAFTNLQVSSARRSPLAVELAVGVWKGDAPLPTLSGLPAITLPPSQLAPIRTVLSADQPAIHRCLALGQQRDSRLWGRLMIRLEVARDGAVSSSAEVETHFPDPLTQECVINTLRATRFPASAEPLDLLVAYRLHPREPTVPTSTTELPRSDSDATGSHPPDAPATPNQVEDSGESPIQ